MIDLNFWEYYSIGDWKVKWEFVWYRFQYENWTLDTIHHRNISHIDYTTYSIEELLKIIPDYISEKNSGTCTQLEFWKNYCWYYQYAEWSFEEKPTKIIQFTWNLQSSLYSLVLWCKDNNFIK